MWAVGYDNELSGLTLRWNGSGWSRVPSGTTDRLWSVRGNGASDVWAVGMYGTIIHLDGAAWAMGDGGERYGSHAQGWLERGARRGVGGGRLRDGPTADPVTTPSTVRAAGRTSGGQAQAYDTRGRAACSRSSR